MKTMKINFNQGKYCYCVFLFLVLGYDKNKRSYLMNDLENYRCPSSSVMTEV